MVMLVFTLPGFGGYLKSLRQIRPAERDVCRLCACLLSTGKEHDRVRSYGGYRGVRNFIAWINGKSSGADGAVTTSARGRLPILGTYRHSPSLYWRRMVPLNIWLEQVRRPAVARCDERNMVMRFASFAAR